MAYYAEVGYTGSRKQHILQLYRIHINPLSVEIRFLEHKYPFMRPKYCGIFSCISAENKYNAVHLTVACGIEIFTRQQCNVVNFREKRPIEK